MPSYYNGSVTGAQMDAILSNLNSASESLTKFPWPTKTGTANPTSSTTGKVGQIFVNTSNGRIYICTTVRGSTYTWVNVGANITVDSALSESSTNPVRNSVVTAALNTKYVKPSNGIPVSDLASAVRTSLNKADSSYQKPSGGIPKVDLASSVQNSLTKADKSYEKPQTGIPETDLKGSVRTSLSKADTAYQKPLLGIPKTDLNNSVQSSLSKADNSIEKPERTVPAGYVLKSDGDGNYAWGPQSGSSGGTRDYVDLYNKPTINGYTLVGNKTFEQIGITAITNSQIDNLFA